MMLEQQRNMLSTAVRPRPAPGVESVGLDSTLLGLASTVAAAPTLSGKVEAIVTIDGRNPLPLGLSSLSPWQQALYAVARQRGLRGVAQGADARELVLGVRSNGRILLAPAAAELSDAGQVFAHVWVTAADMMAVEAAYLQARAAEESRTGEMERALASWTDADAQRRAGRIAEALDHVDPIIVHLEQESLSNTPHDNNLLKSRGGVDSEQYLLSRLPVLPLTEWSAAAKIFVYCFDLLLDAGFRGEEFNSHYLSPARLSAFFDRTLASYVAAMPALPISGVTAPLAEKAASIKTGRAALAPNHQFYRWVHGITLYKEQRFFVKDQPTTDDVSALPASVRTYLESFVSLAPSDSCYAAFRLFVEHSCRLDGPSLLGLHPIEAAIVLLIDAATEDLASDIGMSRGLRCLADFASAYDADDAERANGWTQAAYFCAVVPQRIARRRGVASTRAARNVLKAISARMRFNSWHYMPGHFSRERCPAERHFYLPPALSDTAEWSDQRHRGHMAAEVRYSIRAPAPLTYRGKSFPGLLDLRVMRRAGTPYTLSDLKRANEYVSLLRDLYQAVLDVSVERDVAFSIDGFSNDWFEAVPWGDLT
jgi:hypothetical protein